MLLNKHLLLLSQLKGVEYLKEMLYWIFVRKQAT